ncbi:MAG: TRAP transporter fused permease subunit [Gammaproteobacteria bacterium]
MDRTLELLTKFYLGSIVVIGIAWILDLPQAYGVSPTDPEWIGLLVGVGVAASLLRQPYSASHRWIDGLLGPIAIGCWVWMSLNQNAWIIDIEGLTAAKFVPALVGLLLLIEGMRKSAGLPITILVWILIAYGLAGQFVPGVFQAAPQAAGDFVFYLYADGNAVPGRVLTIVATLVLAFIVLGRIMQVSGAIQFFTDLALALMGGRRGGPAKVAVVASSVFGSINGTAVGNIMSTGIVTIPLMKNAGFRPQFAAAIEAVASNGGQFAPPVMGATAFLIADFLGVPYSQVVLAALVPALLYYVCLFLQVDAIAMRFGLHGLPKEQLPRFGPLLREGWLFLVPLAVLVVLLFVFRFDPAWSALAAAAALVVLSSARQRRILPASEWRDMLFGAGESMLPLLMIAGGAGIVIGVMNSTGLGFSLSLVLTQIGSDSGLLAMLLLTAVISVVLGMGMPTTAIYVVLYVVLVPALIEMGITPMSAHLYIFYFGLLSFLTPPVAVASYVAAGLAGSGMWSTSWEGVKLAAMAYFLPLLWCYNPALLLDGSWLEIVYVVATALIAAGMMAWGLQGRSRTARFAVLRGGVLVVAAVVFGGSTVWLGPASPANLGVIAAGAAILLSLRHKARMAPRT